MKIVQQKKRKETNINNWKTSSDKKVSQKGLSNVLIKTHCELAASSVLLPFRAKFLALNVPPNLPKALAQASTNVCFGLLYQ